MELLELPGWQIEFDRLATVAAHSCISGGAPEACGCGPCRNWALTRNSILPAELQTLLRQLGIPFDRESEVYHNCRLESGLHSYGAWYHFVGRIRAGEQEDSPIVTFGTFGVFFHSRPALLSDALVGKSVVQLEVEANVPWLSNLPEAF